MILRRRRLWFVVLVGFLLAGGAGSWALIWGRWASDADRIGIGMTPAEVAEIMAKSPTAQPDEMSEIDPAGTRVECWFMVNGLTVVTYQDNRVCKQHISRGNSVAWQARRLIDSLLQKMGF